MKYKIEHNTIYYYAVMVSMSHNLVHLAARDSPRQTCLQNELWVSLSPAVRTSQLDYFGNPVTFFTIQEPHRRLSVSALNVVDVHPCPVPDPGLTLPWEQVQHLLRTERDARTVEAYQFTFDSPYIKREPALATYAFPSFLPGRPLLDAVLDLTRRIHEEFRYDPAATTIATPLSQVLELRRGVCQDFAHLEIGCLRSLGLAARYVSGYLLTNPPPGQQRLVGADASHAWLSIYFPGFGWLDIDPTNNQIPFDKHVVLAWGRDYDDVSPIKGVILGGGQHSVTVAVDVVTLKEPDGSFPRFEVASS
jgi:transglutaminase-like putative cysteine protease